MAAVTASPPSPRIARVAELGERLAVLRLCEAPALDTMRRSLDRHGQLTPIVAFVEGDPGSAEAILRSARGQPVEPATCSFT
jgi:hypothetical protein